MKWLKAVFLLWLTVLLFYMTSTIINVNANIGLYKGTKNKLFLDIAEIKSRQKDINGKLYVITKSINCMGKTDD